MVQIFYHVLPMAINIIVPIEEQPLLGDELLNCEIHTFDKKIVMVKTQKESDEFLGTFPS